MLHLTIERRATVRVPTAALELARRGISLLRAKRAVEAALAHGKVALALPSVEDRDALAAVLRGAGLTVRYVAGDTVDVLALRKRLDLTREQFALRFNIPLDTIEKWEAGERQPDAGSLAYLRVIERDPDLAMAAQAE